MGLVLWIDDNKFATGLLEKAFKKAGVEFYTIDSVKDFTYLVDDLNPAVIYLDTQTFLKGKEDFLRQYNASSKMQQTGFILDQKSEETSFLKKIQGIIEKPINPFELPEKIQKICNLI